MLNKILNKLQTKAASKKSSFSNILLYKEHPLKKYTTIGQVTID